MTYNAPVNMIACLASPCQHTIVVGMRFSCTKFSLSQVVTKGSGQTKSK